MTCEESVRLLQLHRPGERTETEQRTLEAHLTSCPSCRSEARRLARTQIQFDRLTMLRPNVPADVAYILSAIESARAPRATFAERIVRLWNLPSIRYSYALAVAVTLVVAYSQLASPTSTPAQGPDRAAEAYVAIRVETKGLPNTAELSDDIRSVLQDLDDADLRQEDARAALQRAGQVTLQSFRLTSDQRRVLERMMTHLQSTSVFRVRLGILGG